MHTPAARRLIVCLWSFTLAFAAPRPSIATPPAPDSTTSATMVRVISQTMDATPGSLPSNFTVMGDTAYFVATDSSNGRELWRTDGTEAGTSLVADISPGVESSFPDPDFPPVELTPVDGMLFFAINGQLWKSDGTGAGTRLVKTFTTSLGQFITLLSASNGLLYFDVSIYSEHTLWRSDGTPAGTVKFSDQYPSSIPVHIGRTLFYSLGTLWKSDGTTSGTVQVGDVTNVSGLTLVGTNLFFFSTHGTTSAELWKTDGTTAGTVIVKAFNYDLNSLGPSNLTAVNGTLYFMTDDGNTGRELWKSDGTTAGTVLVKDINPGAAHAWPRYLTNSNGTLYFMATAGGADQLWKSDGTASGTVQLSDLPIGSSVDGLAAAGSTVFFSFWNSDGSRVLWKSDGTPAGTTPLRNVGPFWMTGVNDILFFEADDASGRGLWKSDGTTEGTIRIAPFAPSAGRVIPANGQPLIAVPSRGSVLFNAVDEASGLELWQSNGTPGGTFLSQDIAPNPASSSPTAITVVGSKVFFVADDNQHGAQVWSMPLTAVATGSATINGETAGTIQTAHTFTAHVAPIDAAQPITYVWQATGQPITTRDGGVSDSIALTWDTPGNKTVTVTASNADGALGKATFTIAIFPGAYITPESGGSVAFPNLTISVPPGAVTIPIDLIYAALGGPSHPFGGGVKPIRSLTLQAGDADGKPVRRFQQPYTLVVSYGDAEVAALGINEHNLNLAYWNGGAWVLVLPCVGCSLDTVNNRVTALLNHLTEFALVDSGVSAVGSGKSKVFVPIVHR